MVVIALLDRSPTRLLHHASSLPRPGRGPLPPGAAAISGLAEASCRWPLGEVAAEDFGFCGAPRSQGSYCTAHRGLAYAGGGR